MQKSIEDALIKSPANKAPGADELKTEMLKTSMQLNANALFQFWAACGRCGDTPFLWRKAVLISIHKNGAQEDPGNYMPTSLLSQARKIIETALDSAVRRHYSNHWFQLGFQKGKGADLAILRVKELQKRGQNCIAVFDSVPRERLVTRMRKVLQNSLCSMAEAFLTPSWVSTAGDTGKLFFWWTKVSRRGPH